MSWPRNYFACLGLCVSMAACAGGSGGGSSTSAPEIRRGVEGTERVVQRGRAVNIPVAAPRRRVWTELESILAELRIQPTTIGPTDGQLFADGFRLLRLAEHRASYYVDCGTGLNGPVADDAQVLANLRMILTDGPAGTTFLSVAVDAEARPRGGIEGLRSCTSTGRLEDLVAQMLDQRLGADD